ncbi:MAG: hypothetical protein ACO4CS_03995 [bacterium]|jgi:hypothetical protein
MAEIPNLVGVATKDLVEHIGSGSYKASYINWSRTMVLLRQHAPGWMAFMIPDQNGEHLWKSPKGGYLMIAFRHIDGTETSAVPQAVMDNRNNSIEWDRISSRDLTDTHRRGACLAAAFFFGLAAELWAKMPLESGYGVYVVDEDQMPSAVSASASKGVAAKPVTQAKELTAEDFLEACLAKGLESYAAEELLQKINNDYEKGIKTLKSKDDEWVLEMNASCAPAKPAKKTAKTARQQPAERDNPEDY